MSTDGVGPDETGMLPFSSFVRPNSFSLFVNFDIGRVVVPANVLADVGL